MLHTPETTRFHILERHQTTFKTVTRMGSHSLRLKLNTTHYLTISYKLRSRAESCRAEWFDFCLGRGELS
jgi:hypothetical protein